MDFDVFISHSSKDKQVADQACATLERSGVRCWIAPRDIRPGDEYGAAIVHAIDRCRAMVLIFSSNANASRQIPREVERAVALGVPILPIRIEDVVPKDSLAYFVDSVHWLDAIAPPLEDHLQRLADSATKLLQGEEPANEARPDPSPRRLSPGAMRFDRTGSSIWPAVGKFAARSLIVCAGLLVVTFAASRWFGSKPVPPVAAVAEHAAEAPAKTAAVETPVKMPAVQGASEIAEAPKADVHPVIDEPVVKQASRSSDNGTADTPPSDAPKAASVVAVARDVAPPEASPSAAAPPSLVLSAGGNANTHFTAEDASRVERLAAEKKFPLPKYQISEIASHVPAKFRRFIGIWASKIGFNGGLGREGIIILSDVDAQGEVTGVYAVGPPTPSGYDQSQAWFRLMSGKIKDDVLSFVLGTATAVVRFSPPDALFINWTFQNGRSATDIFYPVWILSEHEGASPVAQTRKPN